MVKISPNCTALLQQEYSSALAPDGAPFEICTLRNRNGMQIQIMDWGATWLSCVVPVQGERREVLLGCRPEDYPNQTAYLGASIGRYANRIANARYYFEPNQWQQLVANQGKHQLHGGMRGFDKVRWKITAFFQDEERDCQAVQLTHFSPHGDQGFNGDVQITVRYELNAHNEVKISYDAKNTEDTALNLTNHAYFNLQNAQDGCDVREHFLQLNATQFLPVDADGIPNAPLQNVTNTAFDFRQRKSIIQDFDHAFLLNFSPEKPCAILTAPDEKLRLEVRTSQRALQLYTGNYLAGTPTRSGAQYHNYSGVALETQALPDTPNHPEWWQYGGMVRANQGYHHWTVYGFSTT